MLLGRMWSMMLMLRCRKRSIVEEMLENRLDENNGDV